nr:MAG: methyltransferase domain-containing protein [Leptolyngbya sp. IPPAS B-1204]
MCTPVREITLKSYEEINLAQEVSENDPFTLERYQQFFHYFPSNAQAVLDVGCNTGRGGKVLKELQQDLEIVGLDCVENRLARISRDVYCRTICSYSTNIASEDSAFDVVVAGEFVEHLFPQDVTQTLCEFYRILRPGGRLLLTTPNPNYLLLLLTGRSVLGGAHVSQHYPKELKKQLEETGFSNLKILGSGKVSRYLGEKFPLLFAYGSYLVIADKLSLKRSST